MYIYIYMYKLHIHITIAEYVFETGGWLDPAAALQLDGDLSSHGDDKHRTVERHGSANDQPKVQGGAPVDVMFVGLCWFLKPKYWRMNLSEIGVFSVYKP